MVMSMSAITFLVILLILANFGALAGARGLHDFSRTDDSLCKNSCNNTLEDKRGIPTGANPLHNRQIEKEEIKFKDNFPKLFIFVFQILTYVANLKYEY